MDKLPEGITANPELAHVENIYERMTLAEAEKALICAGLKRNQGNVEKTARQLGMAKMTIYTKVAKMGKSVKDWRNKYD